MELNWDNVVIDFTEVDNNEIVKNWIWLIGGEKSPMYIYFFTKNRLLWAERHLPKNKFFVVLLNELFKLIKYFIPLPGKKNILEINLSLESINKQIQNYKIRIREKYQDPIKKAQSYGIRDYIFRRVGK